MFFLVSLVTLNSSRCAVSPSRPHHSLRAVSIPPLHKNRLNIRARAQPHSIGTNNSGESRDEKSRKSRHEVKRGAARVLMVVQCDQRSTSALGYTTLPICSSREKWEKYVLYGGHTALGNTHSKQNSRRNRQQQQQWRRRRRRANCKQMWNDTDQVRCQSPPQTRYHFLLCMKCTHTHTWNQIQTLYTLNWWRVEVYDTDTCVCQPS